MSTGDKTGEVKMYLDHVTVVIEDATDEALAALAFQIEGLTKRNIQQNGQIDTGFMLNSVYSITPEGSGYAEARAEAQSHELNRAGEFVDVSKRMAPEVALPEDASAGVCVGANYAIFQEAQKPFLFPAGEEGAKQGGGTVEAVYKDLVKD